MDPTLSPIVQIVREFILGANNSFEDEIKHLRDEIAYKDEILTINVKNNTRVLRQQGLMFGIIKLEHDVEKLQFWADGLFVLQATLNSLLQQWWSTWTTLQPRVSSWKLAHDALAVDDGNNLCSFQIAYSNYFELEK